MDENNEMIEVGWTENENKKDKVIGNKIDGEAVNLYTRLWFYTSFV